MKPKKYPCFSGKHPASLALSMLLGATAIYADSQTVPFNIPAQPLGSALTRFSTATGLQVLYEGDITGSIQASALNGNYTPDAALHQLTRNTGLSYRYSDAGTVTLVKNAAESQSAEATQSGGAGQVMPKVTVEADSENPYNDPNWTNDPYNSDYNRPNATTATKTDTSLMETPANIQVMPRSVLNDQQTITLEQSLKNIAGVTIDHGHSQLGDSFGLRGFQTLITYRNGYRFNGEGDTTGARQLANIERIEVLKGPAAVLYGQNDPGGMINVVTKQPLATAYYSLQQQFGSFDFYRTSVDATGPLTKDDTLLYRFNASFEDSASFRELIDSERIFLAPIMKWNISPRTQATLEMEYRHDNLTYDGGRWPTENGRFINIPRSRNLMERLPNTVEDVFIGFNWSHQFNDDWTLRHQFNTEFLDRPNYFYAFASSPVLTNGHILNRTIGNIVGHNNSYYTDINLTGHFDTLGLKHTLLLGGDYYRWDRYSNGYFNLPPLAPIDVFNPVHTGITTFPKLTEKSIDYTDFYGLYAQDQIKLPYGVQVMGGLRYQYIHNTNTNTTPAGVVKSHSGYTVDAVTPRVGLLWQAKNWLSVYGNYAENFGVANTSRDFSGKLLPPESAQQWELGAKTQFFDGRLSASLSYFDLTKQNVATIDTNISHVCSGGPCSVARGEVRSLGPELDIRGEILPGWNLIATYANLNTHVTKDNDPELLGNRLFGNPRNTGSLWTTFDFPQETFKGIKIGGGVTLQDGSTDGTKNGFHTAGFATVDLLAAYSLNVGKTKVSAQLNVNNLLDKHYFANVFFNGAGTAASIGPPRSFMGSIRIEY